MLHSIMQRATAGNLFGVLPKIPYTPVGTAVAIQTTKNAGQFVDSIGVNTHWGYLDTVYSSKYSQLKQLLIDSRIQHVRDYSTSKVTDLKANNIYTTVLIDNEGGETPGPKLNGIRTMVQAGAVAAIEGPNEPDLFWVNGNRLYNGQAFPAGALQWQKDMYAIAKADPILSSIPVVGMSFGKTYWGGGHPYAKDELADSADKGNFHPYPAGIGYVPTFDYAGITKYYNNTDFPSIALDVYPLNFSTYRPPFGTLPMVATETGYSTWKYGQSEAVHGKYIPRMFLENFRLGIERTYSYELVDHFADANKTNREYNFGLLRNDLSKKPAYNAVQEMLTVIGDQLSTLTSVQKQLQYKIVVQAPSGYDKRYLHHVVLQKLDESFVIALWHEVGADDLSSFYANGSPFVELQQPAMNVSLSFTELAAPNGITAQVFDTAGILQPAATEQHNEWFVLSVPDRVTLVTIPKH